jgi:hypothetical protein
VTVTATETQTHTARTAVTDQSGHYAFSDLKDGIYRVDAEIKGFKPFSRDALEEKAGAPVRVDVTLELGASPRTSSSRMCATAAAAREIKQHSDFVVDAIVWPGT